MSYQAFLDGAPLMITVAPTDGVHGKESHPNLLETPDEIATCWNGRSRRPRST